MTEEHWNCGGTSRSSGTTPDYSVSHVWCWNKRHRWSRKVWTDVLVIHSSLDSYLSAVTLGVFNYMHISLPKLRIITFIMVEKVNEEFIEDGIGVGGMASEEGRNAIISIFVPSKVLEGARDEYERECIGKYTLTIIEMLFHEIRHLQGEENDFFADEMRDDICDCVGDELGELKLEEQEAEVVEQ